ncbi:LuxR C-terminal-related transcriptional regulator [Nocardia sp. NPDC059239]|uniref:LuxR C-terminal-related transcriptional regulator n=1 Tax=unclassified Nocardia TaxID=2637762 RepID=UPI0036C70E48
MTFVGVGGVGKSRLSVNVAAAVSDDFEGGVWLVELASLTEEQQVLQAIIDTLGLPEPSSGAQVDLIISHVAQRDTLLVLDNCEHLLDSIARLTTEMLRRSPRLKILATSRTALNVPGEHRIMVDPLPVPDEGEDDTETILSSAAVALFVERAKAVVPSFTLTSQNEVDIVQICRQLDGIPLAIELAAARLRILSTGELASRLNKNFSLLTGGSSAAEERHQTLRATLDWSYSLCTPAERSLWSKASVFAGTFSLAAAEAVCDEKDSRGIIDAITGLIDKSILIRTESAGAVRFRILEVIRQYGELIVDDPAAADESQRRHLDWCLDLVSRAADDWFGPRQSYWSSTLRAEHPNLRAAFNYCRRTPSAYEAGLRLAGPYFLWMAFGSLAEGRQWLDTALSLTHRPSVDRARALWTNAFIANTQGQYEHAAARARECAELGAELGDTKVAAMGDHQLGCSALFGGRLVEATALMESALCRYLEVGAEPDLEVNLRFELGLAYLFAGHDELAREQYEISRSICEGKGEDWLRSYALWGTGLINLHHGEIDLAAENVRKSLEIKSVFRDPLGMAVVIETAAWIAQERGDAERTAILLGAASRHWITFSVRDLFGNSQFGSLREKSLGVARHMLGEDTFRRSFDYGSQMTIPDSIAFAAARVDPAALPRKSSAIGANTSSQLSSLLTPRETEICELITSGLSNKEIAKRLFISPRTAESHVQRVLNKLGFHSRAQIAVFFLEHGNTGNTQT